MSAQIIVGGEIALVDSGDLERISAHRWWLRRAYGSRDKVYVYTQFCGRTVYLHRFLLDAGPDVSVDHVDGNGLNNRRTNLRLGTVSQNNANRGGYSNRTGFRGVYFKRRNGTYQARLSSNGVARSLGHYADPADAARAYDAAALGAFGEFARLNFPLVATAHEAA